jgi:hypothetical protein
LARVALRRSGRPVGSGATVGEALADGPSEGADEEAAGLVDGEADPPALGTSGVAAGAPLGAAGLAGLAGLADGRAVGVGVIEARATALGSTCGDGTGAPAMRGPSMRAPPPMTTLASRSGRIRRAGRRDGEVAMQPVPYSRSVAGTICG